MNSFRIEHFAFDGEALGAQAQLLSQLSPKWLAIGEDLLATHGPVFTQNMGSTLSHYEIKCAAGLCWFSVAATPALFGVVLPVSPDAQSRALLTTFVSQLQCAKPVLEHCRDVPEFLGRISSLKERPVFIVVNWLNPNIPAQDQEAMFQLATHFAGAYLQWHTLAQRAVPADGPASRVRG